MKLLFFVTFLALNFAQANQCPFLAGTYECKNKEGNISEMVFKQETVNGIEKYEMPLVDGMGTVYADGEKHFEGKDYLLAKCVKNKLEVEEWQIEDSGNPILTLLGNYRYSLNKKKTVLEGYVVYEITIGGEKSPGKGQSFRCNRKQ